MKSRGILIMAKFGKFVGLNHKAFDMFEADRFRELFNNVFGDIGSIHCDGYSDVGIGFFTVKNISFPSI